MHVRTFDAPATKPSKLGMDKCLICQFLIRNPVPVLLFMATQDQGYCRAEHHSKAAQLEAGPHAGKHHTTAIGLGDMILVCRGCLCCWHCAPLPCHHVKEYVSLKLPFHLIQRLLQ